MTSSPVRIAIGNVTFDHATSDDRGDLLHRYVAERQTAVDSLGAPEGRTVRYNAAGEMIGMTIVNARRLLERDAKITITPAERIDVSAATLAPAIGLPAA